MTEQKSIKKNFAMNVLLTASSFVFPLITFPYVTRVIGATGTGVVAFSTSFIAYFALFAQLGIPTYGIRACAQVRDDSRALSKTVLELLVINALCTAVSYVVLLLTIAAIPRLNEQWPLFLISSTLLLFNCIGMEWLFKGLEEYSYIAIRSLIFKAIAIVLMFLTIHSPDDYVMYGLFTVFASSASAVCNLVRARKIVSFKGLRLRDLDLKKHVKSVLIFLAMSCAVTIYTNLDVVMLGFISGDTEVGYYNASIKIKNMLVAFITSLGAVLLPRASYCVENGQWDEFYRLANKSFRFVLLAGLPCAFFFTAFSCETIMLLAGEGYSGAVLAMQFIIPALVPIGLSNISGIQILVPLGKEKTVLLSEIIGGAVDLMLNLMLIPLYGASGAAVSTLLAECVVFIVQLVALRKTMPRLRPLTCLLEYAVVSTISLVVAIAVKAFVGLDFLLQLIVCAVAFFLVYFAILLLRKDEFVVSASNETKRIVLKK